MRPRLLDLFCGAGGAAKGYTDAGFYVVGVDIEDQPRYAGNWFVQADALDVLRLLVGDENDPDELLGIIGLESGGDGESFVAADDGGLLDTVDAHHVFHAPDYAKPASRVNLFDAIHASPPCQDYSTALRHLSSPQPRLIEPVRDLLKQTGKPWVIENVVGSSLPFQQTLNGANGLELCGTQFGMRIGWHRLFESNVGLYNPARQCRCGSIHVLNPHNQAGRDRMYEEFGPGDPERPWREHRGTPWMKRYEAREAIPPAYTEFIGVQLLAHLESRAAA